MTEGPLARWFREMADAVREPEDAAILTGDQRRPSEVGWPTEPQPIQRNSIVMSMPVSEAIGMGLIDPPPGYVPPPPPPRPPWRVRLRMWRQRHAYRLRIALANRLAGFDVEADRY